MEKLIRLFLSIFRIKNRIIFESLPTYTDNAKAIYDYLIKNKYNLKYEIIWFCDKECKISLNDKNVKIVKVWKKFRKLSLFGFIKYMYYLKNAKYIMYCNRGIHKFNKKSIRIFLNHGLPLKRISDLKIVTPEVDYVICPSNFFRDVYNEQLHVNKEKILTLGSPRNDIMYNYKKEKKNFTFLKDKHQKVILWLPTFRNHVGYERNDSNFNFPLGLPIIYSEEKLMEIDKLLKKNKTMLLIKLHPVQDVSKVLKVNLSNIKLISDSDLLENNISLTEFYSYVDAFITDYSGVYYDMLLTNKQIGFTIDDFEEYNKTRGFPFSNPLDKMAGMKIKNIEELKKYLENVFSNYDEWKMKREEMVKLFYEKFDGESSKRIVDYFKL